MSFGTGNMAGIVVFLQKMGAQGIASGLETSSLPDTHSALGVVHQALTQSTFKPEYDGTRSLARLLEGYNSAHARGDEEAKRSLVGRMVPLFRFGSDDIDRALSALPTDQPTASPTAMEQGALALGPEAVVPAPIIGRPTVAVLEQPAPRQETPSLVTAFTDFSLVLFKQLARSPGPGSNIIASPLSIAVALSMAANGAEGKTREGILQTLRLRGMSVDGLNAAIPALSFQSTDPQVVIRMANSIWVDPRMTLRADYQAFIEQVYAGRVDSLAVGTEAINAWIAGKTDGKITNMLPSLDPMTAVLLINAMAFSGRWTHPFPMENTHQGMFRTDTGKILSVPMMSQSESPFRYTKGEGCQWLRLPYGSGKVSMVIVLPDGVMAARDFVMQFSTWRHMSMALQRARAENGYVIMPKFAAEFDADPNDILKDMGMTVAYDEDRADFSRMVERAPDNVYISDVRHRARIDVTEEGTEAQATTVVEERLRSGGGFYMDVNRPFFYVIQEDKTGLPLFMGWVSAP